MNPLDYIGKLITEHASSTVLGQHLDFVKAQFTELEGKVSELQIQIGKLQAQLAREQSDNKNAQQELKLLQQKHAEDTRISGAIEFRRGLRTANKWLPFCPQCHLPASKYEDDDALICSGNECKWRSDVTWREATRIMASLT